MVKVLDPDGIIIGAYETEADVPDTLPNRTMSFWYPKEECQIVPVTDEKDRQRLQRTMEECMRERRER